MTLPDTHQGCAGLAQHATHVGEVYVDQSRHLDHLGNTLDTLAQYVVSYLERFRERAFASDEREQSIVGHRDNRVYLRAERGQTFIRSTTPARPLERERERHNTNGQSTHLSRDRGNDRRAASPGPAAHTGSDKDQIGLPQRCADFCRALHCRARTNRSDTTSAQPFGIVLAQAEAILRLAERKHLCIGVHSNKTYPAHMGIDHAVDRVHTGTAHANYHDIYLALGVFKLAIGHLGSNGIFVRVTLLIFPVRASLFLLPPHILYLHLMPKDCPLVVLLSVHIPFRASHS